MMDPKKLLEKLPRFDRDKPFRFLGRRVVQAMAEAATANLVLGQRTAPGQYLVVRLLPDADTRDTWEQQFAESRPALVQELERESQARDIKPRSALAIDLVAMTDAEAERGEAERALSTVLEGDDLTAALAQLREEREVILPRRVRTLLLESEPKEAQAYVDHRPVGVTPCRVEDIGEGEHVITLSRPGFLLHEETYRVEPGRPGQKLVYRARLQPEPDMGVLEVKSFPPGAQVTVGAETRVAPARLRLPAGPLEVRVEMEEYEPQTLQVELPPSGEERPHRLQVRLRYQGPQKDEIAARLIIYKPGTFAPAPVPERPERPENRISSFFRDVDEDLDRTQEWDLSPAEPAPSPEPEVLAERPLRRGVILIGREDPRAELVPDIRLFDAENSVSRGCHAWLWIYADKSTGATYNTLLIGNNSPAGIRVDGQLVMETRRLSEDSEIEIGNFRMRVVKEVPEAWVEIDL
ncbi:MAG: PEGA domain-containing protein [Armatimonadota bacterium]